jgi:cyclopropane fatty-acyl-phospholipid synthase-like methyltransferase
MLRPTLTAIFIALLSGCAHHAHHQRGGEQAASLPTGHVHGDPHHHRFTDPAAMAASWDDPARDRWQDPAGLVAAMEVTEGMTVADVGTGTGYLVPHLVAAVGASGRVVAQDLEPAMLDWVRQRATTAGWSIVSTVQASAMDPNLPAGSLDRAVMVNVWHHIEQRSDYAAKLGAAKVWGCDFDPKAVEVARDNLARNGTPEVRMVVADVLEWKSKLAYDIVAANIFHDILEAAFPQIIAAVKPGGALMVSGILKSQADGCLAVAARLGIDWQRVVTRGKWVSAIGRRPAQ